MHYTREKQLPRDLRRRIINYYALHHHSAMMDEKMLEDLPRSLKLQMDLVTHQQVRRMRANARGCCACIRAYGFGSHACGSPLLTRRAPHGGSWWQVFLKLPMFRLCEKEGLLLITQCLRPGLALPDEALVREGEYGVGLFFLMKVSCRTVAPPPPHPASPSLLDSAPYLAYLVAFM